MQRQAAVADHVGRVAVEVGLAVKRIACIELATHCSDQRASGPIEDVDHTAAGLVDAAGVADQPQREVLAGLEQQLPAEVQAVAVVDAVAVAQVGEIAVTCAGAARQAEGHTLADRAGVTGPHAAGAVLAEAQLHGTTRGKRRLAGHHADDAGRGVLPEQRALRAPQHFYALHVHQVANLRGRARAVHAIDEHTHRGLDARVVGAVAKAADQDIGLGRGLLLRHPQRGHNRLQIQNVVDLRLGKGVCRGDGDRHRDVLQGLLALCRGDYNFRQCSVVSRQGRN